MKAKIFIFSTILIFLFGCSKKKSKIEIIPNYDTVYLPSSMVTEKAKSVSPNFEKNMNNSFKQTLEKISQNENIEGKRFYFGYTLYINEKGKVDKIRTEYVINKRSKLSSGAENKEFTKLILPEIEKWYFIPAKLNGTPVKSRKLISLGFIFKNGEFVAVQPIGNLDNKSIFFVSVEQMPSPIGGIAGIQKRIAYPEIARKAGIQGRVFVKAFIDEKGDVVKTEIIKGIGGGCDKAASGAVKQTKFEPGRQKGKAVKVQVTVPILFRLQL